MNDISKQIAYWRDGALEDWEVAQELIEGGRTRHGLFFAHLALEKMLKAHVCRQTNQPAPKIHNLVRLAELSKLAMTRAQLELLAEMNAFSLEGRYPDAVLPTPDIDEARKYIERAGEVLKWLNSL